MPSTTNFEFGQIVLVRFPFTDQFGSKQRPAVIISSQIYNQERPDVILMALTSQIHQKSGFGEAVVQSWQSAGLLNPSIIKPVVFTAEKSIVKKTLGRLNQRDQVNLLKIINLNRPGFAGDSIS